MNQDIRPQDDLFGHVNGTWLETTDIPSDRSSWGPFVQLAETAEEHVRQIIESATRTSQGRADGQEPQAGAAAEDLAKVAALYAAFMDTERINALGARPGQPLLDAAARLRDVRDLAAFLGEFERLGGTGLFGSFIDTDDRDS